MPDSSASNDGRWSRWWRLSWTDRARLLGLVVLVPLVDIALRTLGLRRTQSLLGLTHAPAAPAPCTDDVMADAQRIAELANIAGRHGAWQNTCLRQALAVQWWLYRRGLPAQLRIGARRVGNQLDAHAWVELDGVPLAQSRELPPVLYMQGN